MRCEGLLGFKTQCVLCSGGNSLTSEAHVCLFHMHMQTLAARACKNCDILKAIYDLLTSNQAAYQVIVVKLRICKSIFIYLNILVILIHLVGGFGCFKFVYLCIFLFFGVDFCLKSGAICNHNI